ncbi:MAG: hypothetical protein KatS3mg056_0120 [Chloroflexus sp.]|jgi:hypothetical protein|nr:MAG: hypothetical protein KatS3mg056_0120 [Chloroflexus sp.]
MRGLGGLARIIRVYPRKPAFIRVLLNRVRGWTRIGRIGADYPRVSA